MVSYEHKVKNIYLGSPYNEWTPIIPGDYTLLRWPCDEGFHVPLREEWQAVVGTEMTVSQFKTNLHVPIVWARNSSNWTWPESASYSYLRSLTINWLNVYITIINWNNTSWYPYMNSTNGRKSGFSLRAFRNTPIIPDGTWTETVTGKVWYNSDLWLISILVWTNQYITMQDKNVWATVVWNDWDTLTNNNRWKYFQRWNNYGFTYWSTWDTSSTQVDASNYWPSNPYSSSTFITPSNSQSDWSSVRNDNLRWYTDFNS